MTDARTVSEMAELAGGLAHELRNPLSTMMVNLTLLAEDLADEAARPEDTRRRALIKVETLRREAARLQRLFDEFLHLTGERRLECADVDIGEVVARLVEFFAPEAGRENVSIALDREDQPLICSVDERLLRQALLNLAINARQAMPEGGTLRFCVRRDGDSAVIALTDTGVGIESKQLERIFRPFYSTKAGGSGLGLPITQRIVGEHGGTLACKSEVGRGTTFTIRLPLAAAGTSGPPHGS